MTVQKIAAMRVLEVRRSLGVERGHAAISLDELMDDALLAAIAELVRPGRTLTKAGLAQACEDAKRNAATRIGADLCWCGHPYAEHLARRGCTQCDACTGPRRIEVAQQPGPHAVGADVLVIAKGSRYYARRGFVVALVPDSVSDGLGDIHNFGIGPSVQLLGTGERVRFEHSELVTVPKAPLADYARTGK